VEQQQRRAIARHAGLYPYLADVNRLRLEALEQG
jgi:hypothetical protein